MARDRTLAVADQRALTPRLRWLALQAPDLAREVRAGQYLLLRCADPGAADPPLRRALWVAAAEPALGQVALLYDAAEDIGLRWLARARTGDVLDCYGPLGRPIALGGRSRALLLIGAGPGLAALLPLAREVLARGGAATLLAGAQHADLLPPAGLLPPEVEFQSVVGPAVALLDQPAGAAALAWADQIALALPDDQLAAVRERVRAARLRAERGLATALVERPLLCGSAACGACAVELRGGRRALACLDGPAFDLRDLGS